MRSINVYHDSPADSSQTFLSRFHGDDKVAYSQG